MKKTYFILIFVMVLLSSIVISVPPFIQGEIINQISISVPKLLAVEVNKDFRSHFHVMDSGGFLLDNTTTDCLLHVYNTTGEHILETNLDFGGVDYEKNIPGNILTKRGIYSFIVNCNNTEEAGFVSINFEVTRTGRTQDLTNSSLSSLSLFFLVLIAASITFFYIIKNYIRWGFFVLSFIFLDILTFVAHHTAINNNLADSIVQPLYITFYVLLILTLFAFFLVLIILTDSLRTENFKKDNFKDEFG